MFIVMEMKPDLNVIKITLFLCWDKMIKKCFTAIRMQVCMFFLEDKCSFSDKHFMYTKLPFPVKKIKVD